MSQKNRIFVQVTDRYRQLRYCRRRMAELDGLLHALGLALWQTDLSLRLTDSHGMEIAESFHGRLISDFYREVYDLNERAVDPVQAHVDASKGHSVTLHIQHLGRQLVMLVEPKRDDQGVIIGTLGMALKV